MQPKKKQTGLKKKTLALFIVKSSLPLWWICVNWANTLRLIIKINKELKNIATVHHFLHLRSKADEKTEHHLNPLKVLHCVDELMAEDSIIVADGGDFVGSAAYILKPRGPLRWLDPGSANERNSWLLIKTEPVLFKY